MTKDKAPTMIDENKPEMASPTRPTLIFDVEKYQKALDDSDLPEEKKREFLETLWLVVSGFADLGFDIHPVQQAISEGCGQDLDLTSFMAENVISSRKGLPQKQFSDAVDCSDTQEVKGMES